MLCTFADARIAEASGIVASAQYANVLYTHNDSGDAARFFVLDDACRTRATIVLAGVQARDWEDISRGPRNTLWLGDIGDNSGTRDRGILLHRVVEPSATATGTVRTPSVAFRFRYADGPHDAEALMVHPRTGQVLIVTKGFGGGAVYAASQPLEAAKPNILQPVGRVPIPEVTSGDISPDGSHVVLRNYTAAYEWTVKGDDVAAAFKGEPTRIPLPRSPQGEAITYGRDGRSLIVTSEGVGATVQDVERTPAASPLPARSARSSP
ncbi:MAG: hypothetical protein QOE05_258, partial [Actinomycetota bacterium]|nr:hypothetical protein [Actinomycetota bacterium]